MPDVDQAPPPAVPQPGEHPSDYCGPCKSGKHAKCYEPCLCRDRGHGAPVSPRTLPVTPAERCLATCLRAWLEWYALKDDEPRGSARTIMLDMWEFFDVRRLVDDTGAITPTGAALLARVEAAERTPETVLRAMLHVYQDAAVEAEAEVFRAGGTPLAIAERRMLEAQDAAANMRATAATYAAEGFLLPWLALRTDYAARLAGTTPIDAPPAKEPR